MKKSYLIGTVVVMVVAVSAWWFMTKEDAGQTVTVSGTEAGTPAYNPLPLRLLTMDSAALQLSEKSLQQPMIAILFNPGCDHCQHQAEEMKSNMSMFKDVTLVMIAAATLKEIRDFSVEYGLAGQPNVYFTQANPMDVYNNFGSVPVPYILLYNKSHKLVHEFRGNANAGEIAQYLR